MTIHSSDVALTIRKAMAHHCDHGSSLIRRSAHEWEWDAAGRCESPVPVDRYGRGSNDPATGRRWDTMSILIHAPCRRCRRCLWQRQSFWAAMALKEHTASCRTWFGTITLRPEEHARFEAIARKRSGSDLDGDNLQKAVMVQEAKEMTKYFKRLRKAGLRFRYLFVIEFHKTGWPHFHVLINELIDGQIKKALLDGAWKHGFTQYRLVKDARQIFYVTKYLSKSASARIRSSLRYGRREDAL